MSAPVIILSFSSPGGQPFSLNGLDANFAALVAAINALAAEPLLQFGVTPGAASGFMPVTGGSFAGQITAPSVLIGPVAGPQYPAVTTNDLATTGAAGVVKKAAANTDAAASVVSVDSANASAAPAGGTGTAAGGWDTAGNRDAAIAVINSLVTLANELKADVNTLKADLNAQVTRFNALQASLRTALVLS